MILNSEMIIEEFDNGFTIKWRDMDGRADNENIVAKEGEHVEMLGKQLWDDIDNIMDANLTTKVRVTIKCEPIKNDI